MDRNNRETVPVAIDIDDCEDTGGESHLCAIVIAGEPRRVRGEGSIAFNVQLQVGSSCGKRKRSEESEDVYGVSEEHLHIATRLRCENV